MGLLMGQYLDSRPLPGGHYLAGLAGCPKSTAQEVSQACDGCWVRNSTDETCEVDLDIAFYSAL